MNPSCLVFSLTLCTLAVVAGAAEKEPPPQRQSAPAYEGTIVAVGNSLTAGLGVAEESAYPALLERKLASAGFRYRVVNAGISGETSSGTLSRINWVLTLKPDIVILETGANDGLRGIEPALIRKNIQEILRVLKQANVATVLAGMQMVQNLGREYTDAFRRIYPEIAKQFGIPNIPFFLAGVAGQPALNQVDGIHPTAEGYKRVVETVYPYVVAAIRERRKGSKP